MMGSGATAPVGPGQLRQVQSIDHFHDEARQMILREPIFHRWRQQVIRLTIYCNESAHSCLINDVTPTNILLNTVIVFHGKVRQSPRKACRRHTVIFDILPSLKEGDSYGATRSFA